MFERVLTIPDPVERENLTAFLGKALRLDEAAVVRLRTRTDGRLSAWASTGFDALAVRVVAGSIVPDDTSAAADQLIAALGSAVDGRVDPGFSMDSAWKGALPPDQGFEHVDDVPARVLIDLAQRGAALAKEHGSSHGPPVSLLDQQVLPGEPGVVLVHVLAPRAHDEGLDERRLVLDAAEQSPLRRPGGGSRSAPTDRTRWFGRLAKGRPRCWCLR